MCSTSPEPENVSQITGKIMLTLIIYSYINQTSKMMSQTSQKRCTKIYQGGPLCELVSLHLDGLHRL